MFLLSSFPSTQGDSGGPLLMKSYSNDGPLWTVVGVVSGGAGCGEKGLPRIYTRVDRYLDWIHSKLIEL
jgi:secreted trypsin-like serine protease